MWDFYLWSGACYGYDDFKFGSLCALELFAKTWGFVGLCVTFTLICVSGALVVDCYWNVT